MAEDTTKTEERTVETAGIKNTNEGSGGSYVTRIYTGRRTIYTDEVFITRDNVIDIVNDSLTAHEINRTEMEYLRKYEKGKQPIFYRTKPIRPEINVKIAMNFAKLITDFKIGYEFSSPVTLVQRSKTDFHKPAAEQTDSRVSDLNEMFFEQDKFKTDMEVMHDAAVTGVGYELILPSKTDDDYAPFTMHRLKPENTFVVYSNDSYREPVMGVSYTENTKTKIKSFTVYTNDTVYMINGDKVTSEVPNLLGMVPIVEFDYGLDKQACFEAVIPLMDGINLLYSDLSNDVAQYVQSILWLHNCRISDEQEQTLRDAGFIQTSTTADGHEAKVSYVVSPLNHTSVSETIKSMYQHLLEIAGVPGRDSASGGNTGSAIMLSNGWQLAETSAQTMETLFKSSENRVIELALRVIRTTNGMPEDIKGLKRSDVFPKFTRNKTYDLVSRVSAMVNMLNAGIDPVAAITTPDIFPDSQQVAVDSIPRIDKILFEVSKATANSQNKEVKGDGNTVNGVKTADDVNAEQNREDEPAV
jgi:SPP1 family phage portal protein